VRMLHIQRHINVSCHSGCGRDSTHGGPTALVAPQGAQEAHVGLLVQRGRSIERRACERTRRPAADELSRRRAGRYSRVGRLGTLSRAGSTASTPVALQKAKVAVRPCNAVAAQAIVDCREAWAQRTRRYHSRQGLWSLLQQRQPRSCRCCVVYSLLYSGRRCDDVVIVLQLTGARRSNGSRARACVWLGRGVLVGRQQAAWTEPWPCFTPSKGTKP
jgi:hypothetical protein